MVPIAETLITIQQPSIYADRTPSTSYDRTLTELELTSSAGLLVKPKQRLKVALNRTS